MEFKGAITSEDSVKVHSEENWRKKCVSWELKLSFLLESSVLSDVRVIASDGTVAKAFRAHKFILSVASEVFETLANGVDQFELDESPENFEHLLKFLYHGYLEDPDISKILEVLRLSKKYLVYDSEGYCRTYINENIDIQNVFRIYHFSALHGFIKFKKICQNKIQKEIHEILVEKNFVNLEMDDILVVLEQKILNMRETELFDVIVKWIKFKGLSKAQKLMKNFCFLNMTSDEFAWGAGSSGFLTENQFRGISSAIANDKSNFPDGFKTSTRGVYGELSFVSERHKYDARYVIRTLTNSGIFIKVDTPLEILEFELMSRLGDSEYNEKVTLRVTDTENEDRFHWKIVETTKFESKIRSSTFSLKFENSLKLDKAKRYSLNLEMHDPYQYPTLDLLDWTLETDGVTFKFFQYPKSSSCFPFSRIVFHKI